MPSQPNQAEPAAIAESGAAQQQPEAGAPAAREFKVGDAVVLAPGVVIEGKHILSDGAAGVVAEVVEDLEDDEAYKVANSSGAMYWYSVGDLRAVDEVSMDNEHDNRQKNITRRMTEV